MDGVDGSVGGDMMQSNMMRGQMPANTVMGGFQMPYGQGNPIYWLNVDALLIFGLSGMPMQGMSGGMNIASQGPLLSNGNYTGLKPMNPHTLTNTDSFVAMQPQMGNASQGHMGMSNMQYMPTGGAQVGGQHPPAPVQHGQMQQGHGQMGHMMGRQNMLPHPQGHMNMGNMSGQEMHGVQGNINQDMSQARYMQIQPTNAMPMHQMNQGQMGQHMGGQQGGMNMHNYGMAPQQQPSGGQAQVQTQQQQQYIGQQQGQQLTAQALAQQQAMMHNSQHSSISGRALVPKSWHTIEHNQVKDSMVEEIVKLLKSRRPNATEDWHGKLPHMAKRLEEALYHDANSLEEYSDHSTLKHRLQQLALSMGNKSGGMPGQGQGQGQGQSQSSGGKPMPMGPQGQAPQGQQMQAMGQQQGMPLRPQGMQQQQMPMQGQQQMHGQQPMMQYGQTGQHMAPHMPHMQVMNQQGIQQYGQYQQQQQAQQRPSAPGQYAQIQGTMNMSTSYGQQYPQQHGQQHLNMQGTQPMMQGYMGEQGNEYMRGYAAAPNQPHMMQQGGQLMPNPNYIEDPNMQYGHQGMPKRVVGSSVTPPMTNAPMMTNAQGMPMMHQGQQQGMQNMMQQQQIIGPGQPLMPPGQGFGPPGVVHTDEHRRQVLKQQQQRLLLLRHASKCPHDDGRCPVTPHCWSMKQLWKHIMSCKDQECKVAHCVSSRYVLSHYSKCKEQTCPVCAPVREAIKRNYERSKDVVNAARNGSIPKDDYQLQGMMEQGGPAAKKARRGDSGKKADSSMIVSMPINPTLVLQRPARSIYPLDPISCAVYSFSNEQIQCHFKNIQEGMKLTVSKVREICKPLIEDLFKFPHAHGVFGTPVDPVMLGLSDYLDIVKVPMDLGTVQKRLDQGSYRDFHNFILDVHLTFDNAMLYNPKNSDVFMLAKTLKREFDVKLKNKITEFERSIEERRRNVDCCLICGELSLKFEPPVYYCNGTCGQRIRRNAVFYSNASNNYHWCGGCYGNIRDGEVMRFPECNVSKAELQKKKHTEEHDEAWVQCEQCQRWVHQVCSLFNARRNVGDEVSYVCPVCITDKRRKNPDQVIVAPSTKKMKAADLPVTTLSDFLEKRIYKRLALAYEEMAEKSRVTVEEVEKCPQLTLRQVSCLDKIQTVREGVYNRYKDKGYPTDFACRTKCLVLFQNIDGQDVLLFGMYVYEYGHKCPAPNQRRVYISYLDSVHYLRPKQYRTMVYHEILISYLDYVKARGFHTAHIWACPPQKGDDYILYVHPADQKTPRPQILRVWYDEMLKRCMERGIILEVNDIHSEYLTDNANDATILPYFEGDYWVNEAEVIIKSLSEGKMTADDFDDNAGVKSKRKGKAKKAVETEVISKTERDPVMAKLASIIEPMKDTFFVARLHPREYAERCAANRIKELAMEKVEEVDESKEKALQEEALQGQDVVPNMPDIKTEEAKNQKQASSNKQPMDEEEDDFGRAAAAVDGGGEEVDDSMSVDEGKQVQVAKEAQSIAVEVSSKAAEITDGGEEVERRVHAPNEPSKSMQIADQDLSVMESKEDDAGRTPETMPMVNKVVLNAKAIIPCGEDMPALTDDTEDVDDIQECEHLDTRQSFLNLCQGNHYQFDQLRRAKHSSMMVLYHLHNPDAPKFVPNCMACHTDILSGMRFHCDRCEVDFCQSCLSRQGSGIHMHGLRPIAVSNTVAQPLTEEQRKERQRSVQLHMQLLNHASTCVKCDSKNCARMKVSCICAPHERCSNALFCRSFWRMKLAA